MPINTRIGEFLSNIESWSSYLPKLAIKRGILLLCILGQKNTLYFRSTQSEWVAGEKKKKSGLIGKLKKLTRKSTNTAEEKEFGSGSDIRYRISFFYI